MKWEIFLDQVPSLTWSQKKALLRKGSLAEKIFRLPTYSLWLMTKRREWMNIYDEKCEKIQNKNAWLRMVTTNVNLDNKKRLITKKNSLLSWQWFKIIVRLISHGSVPWLESFPHTIIVFVNYLSAMKVIKSWSGTFVNHLKHSHRVHDVGSQCIQSTS